MPARKITRKIISGRIVKPASDLVEVKPQTVKASDSQKPDEVVVGEGGVLKEGRPKRYCFFCKNKLTPTYTDIANLRRFLTDRAKILPKQRSGVCSKHQRGVAKNIKYARHLSLLPFVPKV